MTVTRQKNKKWKVDISDGYDPVTGEQRCHRKSDFKSRRDAEQYEADYRLNKLHQVSYKDKISIHYLYSLVKYEDEIRGNKRGTIYTQESYFRQYVSTYFAKADMSKVTIFDIKDYTNQYSDNTVNLIKQPLNLMMKYAVKMEYIDKNPMSNVETPKRKLVTNEQLEEKYLETEQIENIIKDLRDPIYGNHIANFAETLYLTGMRPGELLALEWSNINFDTMKIKIVHTLDYSTNGHAKARPESVKNDGSFRTIDMPLRVKEILIEELNYQNTNDLQNDFVFISNKGTHLSINTINRKIKKTSLKLYGIVVTGHSFRHSHITLLSELGLPLKSIMDRVGHKDVNTTIKIYTHVTEKLKQDLVDKLNEFVPIQSL